MNKTILELMWELKDLESKLNTWLYLYPYEADEVQEARTLLQDARLKIREYIDHSYMIEANS